MPLEEYRSKRDSTRTPEPGVARPGGDAPAAGQGVSGVIPGRADVELRFVVQKHRASSLHYDFRLELGGVLVSWAIPKGPSLDPRDKRLAIRVEDHPLEYADFEGVIPEGEYGAGTVIVWDRGSWEPSGDPQAGLAKGDLKFVLTGEKLTGGWVLVRLKPRPGQHQESWLLIKERDDDARPREEFNVLEERPDSIVSGRSVEEVRSPEESGGAGGGTVGVSGDVNADKVGGPVGDGASAVGERGRTIARAGPFLARAGLDAPRASPVMVDLELATLVDEPPAGTGWLSEVKYDGYRAAILLDSGRARVFTRNHNDWTDRLASLARAAESLPANSALIDGEAVVFDRRGISRFEMLQRAIGENPEQVAYVAFDLLHLNGYDLRGLPLTERKGLLRELLAGEPPGSPLRYADDVGGDTRTVYREGCRSDLEGIVCKRASSLYVAGRGRDWVKVKCRQVQEFVVGGFTEGQGARMSLGALLLGVYDAGRLAFAGRAGTGFDDATVVSLRKRLGALEVAEPPFEPVPRVGRGAHWVRPELVVQVAFREWTADGVLRQPVYLGLREDKDPIAVVREEPVSALPSGVTPEGTAPDVPEPAGGAGVITRRSTTSTRVLGIAISNPDKRLFPDSTFTKVDLARYYAAVAPMMLPHVAGRPLTLVRCPGGKDASCFYQRHPETGEPRPSIRSFVHAIGGVSDPGEWLVVDSAEGLVTLAQMGVVEIHTWLSRADAPSRPDQMVLDLDPGEGVGWTEVRDAALLVAEECTALGFMPFLKVTGGKGLHVVVPLEPVWEFVRVRPIARALAELIAARHAGLFTTTLAKSARPGRVFIDYLRNGEGASAIAPYATRNRVGPSCAVPLAWDELTDDPDVRGLTPARVLARVAAGTDPWASFEENARGVRVLRAAERTLVDH